MLDIINYIQRWIELIFVSVSTISVIHEGGKMRRILPLFLILNLVCVGGETIEEYNLNLELGYGGLLKEHIEFRILDLENPTLKYPLAFEPKKVSVRGDKGGLDFEVLQEEDAFVIAIRPKELGDQRITVDFIVDGYVEKLAERYLFAFAYSPSLPTENFKVNLKLPPGGVIASADPNRPSVSPEPSNIHTDGRGVLLEWYYPKLGVNEKINFLVVYEFPGQNLGDNDFETIFPYVIVFVFGFGIALLIYFILLRPRLCKIEVIKEVLSSEENQIVQALQDSRGMKQDELRKQLDYSKARLSKIVSNLERKGIINKERYGKTNILTLNKR